MRGWRAYAFLGGTVLLLMLTFVIVGIASPKVEFFPDNQPNQIIVYIEYPQGTDIEKTNGITKKIEKDVFSVINDPLYLKNGYNYMVESVVSQVGARAGKPETDSGSEADMPHKAKITATMREFKFREGQSSEELRQKIQTQLNGKFPGVSVSVEKDANGPPSGYPVNIEVTGLHYDELIVTAENIRAFINSQNINGIEELKIDVNRNKPGMRIEIDREKAGALGLTAGQIGRQLRRSLFGEKASVYKSGGEDYDINVRFQGQDRYDASALFNQNITFRDQASGKIKEIPVASVVSQQNIVSYSAIKHRGLKRVVTVYSSILPGYNAVEIVNQLKVRLKDFTELPKDVNYSFTGEIEKQDENMAFLSKALALALMLIMLLLVFQFNSISKPAIILLSIFLSFIGVFLGLVIFNMTFVIIMTMMGIISLAGIVVNNSVVLLDYTQLLLDRRRKNNGLTSEQLLPKEEIFQAVVNGGKARLRPVLLTAITTILGLIPLAIGLNINFFSLFMEGDPQIYIGGDNVIFWGPLAWTVIFGLTFATFLTLIIVPVTFYLSKRAAIKINKMDCPSEENLIRMKLDGISSIANLDFDVPNRKLTVFHSGEIDQIEKSVIELNLGGKKISTEKTDRTDFEENKNQKKLLWSVLVINFAFFIIEMTTGLFSKSMGLVADSLDMLADSFVYGISLFAVGGTLIKKKRIAQLAGYFQIILAIIGFVEVLRRFIGDEKLPNFSTMIIVSIFALIANGICLYILQKSKSKEEAHMKASMIFTSNDVIINLGVIIAGIMVDWFSSNKPDLIIGTIVFALVIQGAFRILKLSK